MMIRSRMSLAWVLLLLLLLISDGAASSPFSRKQQHHQQHHHSNAHNSCSNSNDPYKVLGVSPDATQEEIRQSYRKLCLRYHPDKHVQASPMMRRECEDTFKRIQKANSQIGDADSRRQYDYMAAALTGGSGVGGGYGHAGYDDFDGSTTNNPTNVYEDLFSQLFGFPATATTGGRPYRSSSSSSFSYGIPSPFGFTMNGGGGHSSPFFPSSRPAAAAASSRTRSSSSSPVSSSSPWSLSPSSFSKAIFVQKVPVSLEDLYRGVLQFPVHVQVNSFWSRLSAAFRGGIGYTLLYQSLLCALPFVRISRLAAAIMGLYLFCIHLPQPLHDPKYYSIVDQQQHSSSSSSSVLYHINLQPGYKGGTKLVYEGSPGGNLNGQGATIEIVLILQEKKHDLYQRVGNDLHTYLHISSRQAKQGCVVSIPNLKAAPSSRSKTGGSSRSKNGDNDDSCFTKVTIPPRTQKGDIITVTGQGWFNRKTRQYGDLIVHIQGIYNNQNNNNKSSKKKNHSSYSFKNKEKQ